MASSIFGTFRRSKKNKSHASSSGPSSSIFTSTPNLSKITLDNNNAPLPPPPKEKEKSAKNKTSSDKRRMSNSISTPNTTIPTVNKQQGSMRSFMSMMNVMGSLRRKQSSRNKGWGSTMNVSSSKTNEPSEEVPPLVLRKESSASNNNEPGVASSSSSGEDSESPSLRSSSVSVEEGTRLLNLTMDNSSTHSSSYSSSTVDVEWKKNVLLGTKRFNMDPKKGIDFLVEKDILQYTPQDVAMFLKDGYGLNKTSIGNYMGERVDFNIEVLKAFVDLHDFKDLILVQALRQFLWAFRLPGESQKISRMLDAFAERYCLTNPTLEMSVDTCSLLCYSIIMLNTELHNPNVKDKVSLEQFIKRNRGIEGAERFTNRFMASLYNSILYEPFRFPDEDGSNDLILPFFKPDHEGWLYKQSGRPKTWKRLWFILSNNCLYYFKFTADKTPKGIIPLENVVVRRSSSSTSSKLCTMTLYKESPDPKMTDTIKMCKTLSSGGMVPKSYRTVELATHSQEEREVWVSAINANNSMDKFYSDLTLRKMRKAQGQGGGVRKSQISTPMILTTPPQSVTSEDKDTDPNNYFANHNLSAISLSSEHPQVPNVVVNMARSHSESRLLNEERKFSFDKAGTTTSSPSLTRPRLRSTSKSPVVRRKDRRFPSVESLDKASSSDHHHLLLPTKAEEKVEEVQVKLRHGPSLGLTPTSQTIFDKYKKLSMINELMRSESMDEPPPVEDIQFSSASLSSMMMKSTAEENEEEDDGAKGDNAILEDFQYIKLEEEDDPGSDCLISDNNHNYCDFKSTDLDGAIQFLDRMIDEGAFVNSPIFDSNGNSSIYESNV